MANDFEVPLSPSATEHFWEAAKEGYVTAKGCVGPGNVHLKTSLARRSEMPPNMVRVQGSTDSGQEFEFVINPYEVTNEEFKPFVNQGGYRNEKFWRHLAPYKLDGKEVPFNDLIATFRDKSGQLGPSSWEHGTYPKGQETLPGPWNKLVRSCRLCPVRW